MPRSMAGGRWLVLAALLAAAAMAQVAAGMTRANISASTVLEVAKQLPDLSRITALIHQDDAATAFLSNPNSTCTVFAPTNAAIDRTLAALRGRIGLVLQNRSLTTQLIDYHILPNAFTAAQLATMNETYTRSNETMFIMHRGGQVFVYSNPPFPVPLNLTDIQAGGCFVHTISSIMLPQSLIGLIEGWLSELGTQPPRPPMQQWAPVQPPLPPVAGGPLSLAGGAVAAPPPPPPPPASAALSACPANLLVLAAMALCGVAAVL